jgi:site-specific recombinase XerD
VDAWVFSTDEKAWRPRQPPQAHLRTPARRRRAAEGPIHDVRHGYASQLLQDGVELLYVSQQLGHHKPSFTLEKYGHLIPRTAGATLTASTTQPTAIQTQPTPTTSKPRNQKPRNLLRLRGL